MYENDFVFVFLFFFHQMREVFRNKYNYFNFDICLTYNIIVEQNNLLRKTATR